MQAKELLSLIKNRRTVLPRLYEDRPIEKEVLDEILEAANWAPTHKRTEPWRFLVHQGDARKKIADYLGAVYLKKGGAETDIKFKKITSKPVKANTVIAICMKRDPEESIPQWEEEMSVAMAVQNMWLMCTAHGIGAFWASPSAIIHARDLFGLEEDEFCYGLFYMGYKGDTELEGKRNPIEEKVEWINS